MKRAEQAVRSAQKRYEREIAEAAKKRQEAFKAAQERGLSLERIGDIIGKHRSRVDQIIKGK